MKVRQYLKEEWNENSGYITKKGIMDKCFDRLGSYSQYADIEGMYMAVFSYWEHNVENMKEVENSKYVGYELTVDGLKSEYLKKMYGKPTIQLVVPKWVMSLDVKTERHASNLFRKHLKIV
tara:strand:- start:758 stop:1120 length:363 start_codon:yes stop_codon:yes gene_type:complete